MTFEVEKISQTLNEREIGEEDKFIVYFLYDDEDQSVHVEEVEEIDFFEVVQHLNSGGSVFITHRRKPGRIDSKEATLATSLEDLEEPPLF